MQILTTVSDQELRRVSDSSSHPAWPDLPGKYMNIVNIIVNDFFKLCKTVQFPILSHTAPDRQSAIFLSDPTAGLLRLATYVIFLASVLGWALLILNRNIQLPQFHTKMYYFALKWQISVFNLKFLHLHSFTELAFLCLGAHWAGGIEPLQLSASCQGDHVLTKVPFLTKPPRGWWCMCVHR